MTVGSLIAERSVLIHFQPLVSIKKHSIVGLEALMRGRADGSLLGPDALFSEAQASGHSEALDTLCREEALHDFAAIDGRPADLMLFMNLQADQLSGGRFSAAAFQRLAREHGLEPGSLVLELGVDAAAQSPDLRPLIDTLQGFGFTVALDGVELEKRHLELLLRLKPDIVKTSRSLLDGLARDKVRQEQLQCLNGIAHRMGALCAAVGVESEEQASLCLELGADLLQGFHYAQPNAMPPLNLGRIQGAVDISAGRYKAGLAQRWQGQRRERQRHIELMGKVAERLSQAPREGIAELLKGFVNAVASLECLYVLDPQGRQISPTVAWEHQAGGPRSQLFAPAVEGTDQSLKDYYLGLQWTDNELFISEPYVSLATGNLGRTLARRFSSADGAQAIICMDIRVREV